MKKNKYYPAKYFFLILIIISLAFLIVNFWQLGKFNINYQPILSLNKHPEVLGEQIGFESVYYNLIIDRLGINAPIILDVDGENNDEYNLALTKGVAQLKDTSKPGENGNIVIFGHSSASRGAIGEYNTIFSRLEDLEENDEIKIINRSNSQEYNYKVIGREVVGADNIDIIDQNEDNTLTLFTCWPIGTDEKRLVIYAIPK